MKTVPTKRTGEQCVSVSLAELLELSAISRKLPLSTLRMKSSSVGSQFSPLLGRGMEFAETRRYHYGDESRNIDWRVTARTGKAHTKLFTEEKEREVLLCVDLRSTMFFATRGVFKSVQTALMSGYVAWNAIHTGNRFGGLIFDDQNHFEFRPALGKRGVLPFLQQLAKSAHYPLKDQQEKSSTQMMDHAIESLKRVASPGSLIFIISDFRQFSPQSHDFCLQLSKQCDLRLCLVYDPLEAELPKNGIYPVTKSNIEIKLNTFHKRNLEKYQQQFIERRNQVANLGQYRRIRFMECHTDEDCFEIFTKRGSG
jgi:uncharacterized protein (DUF58 family)